MFCDEQGVSRAAELDGLDDEALHVIAFEGDQAVGTCRLRFERGDCKLERMAVSRESRGRGVGGELLTAAEREARARDAGQILLHGQLRARRFYERAGYETLSEEILIEDGIEHVRMSKNL